MTHLFSKTVLRPILGAVFLLAFATRLLAAGAPPLPSYQADLTKTSVSGLSSGGFMAAQFHVAFSSTLVGAGIVAGGPFYCAGSSPFVAFVYTAMTLCMNSPTGEVPDAAALYDQAKIFVKLGDVDDVANLRRARVYLFTGKADTTVKPAVVEQTRAFYRLAGVPEENIRFVNTVNAGHSIITDNPKAVSCDATAPPFINDCDFIQSHEILKHIYGDLKPPRKELSGRIVRFDQREFIHAGLSSMSDDGYAYVPKSCETASCKVHVAFHGCEQGAEKIGNLFYATTGYNEIADANDIIVLYPQAKAGSGFFSAYNPKGCWDFWGYSSLNPAAPTFYARRGTQPAAVKAMLDRLAQPRK